MAKDKVIVTGDAVSDGAAQGVHYAAGPTPDVQAPKDQANEAGALVDATNSGVDKAGAEAASRLKGQRAESVNTTDAVLGEDEKHGIAVKTAQAASFGETYDPKSDPENVAETLVPVQSQNQNNLKHPAGDEFTNPHASKNYLGQLI